MCVSLLKSNGMRNGGGFAGVVFVCFVSVCVCVCELVTKMVHMFAATAGAKRTHTKSTRKFWTAPPDGRKCGPLFAQTRPVRLSRITGI